MGKNSERKPANVLKISSRKYVRPVMSFAPVANNNSWKHFYMSDTLWKIRRPYMMKYPYSHKFLGNVGYVAKFSV